MSLQSGFSEEFIGTDTWLARALGKFSKQDIQVESIGKVQLHPEIEASVREHWQQTLDLRRNALLSDAANEGKPIDVTIKDEQPLPALYVNEGGRERRALFAGPSVALIKYERSGDRLRVVHGLTNYAVRTFMNTRPYQIIDKYGYLHFVDSVSVSVLPTFLDESLGEVGQTFRRHGTNVNEYPGAIGTIAGGFANRNPRADLTLMNPFHAIEKEMYEEGRILPLLDPQEYVDRGILPAGSKVRVDQLSDYTRIIYVMREGQPVVRAVAYDEDSLVCTGIATDINPFAKDPSGSAKQFFKSEYMFLCRTGIPINHYEEKDGQNVHKGWTRNDEHVKAYYFPFTERGVFGYVEGNHPELMGPTSAVITYSLIDFENGREKVLDLVRAIGKHPMYSRAGSKIPFTIFV